MNAHQPGATAKRSILGRNLPSAKRPLAFVHSSVRVATQCRDAKGKFIKCGKKGAREANPLQGGEGEVCKTRNAKRESSEIAAFYSS